VTGPTFVKLNLDWNADPNVPLDQVGVVGRTVFVRFRMNHFVYERFAPSDLGVLTFRNCSRWRQDETNDHGWYLNQCRYGRAAPHWGEFYEIVGDDPQRDTPADWHWIDRQAPVARHFLFYFKDDSFECVADDWTFGVNVDIGAFTREPIDWITFGSDW